MNFNQFIKKVTLTSIINVIVLFLIYGLLVQSENIKQSFKTDIEIMSKMIFKTLYRDMQKGANSKELEMTILDIQEDIPHSQIKIYRNADIAKEYGVSNNNKLTPTAKKALESAKEDFIQDGEYSIYTFPLIWDNKCKACHSSAVVGKTAGVIEIKYPIAELKISLKNILILAMVLFIMSITIIFFVWNRYLTRYVVNPLKELMSQMKSVVSHADLNKGVILNTDIEEIKRIEEIFNEHHDLLLKSYIDLEKVSVTDKLTGILNRHKLDEVIEYERSIAKRYNVPFCIIVADLDKFKPINDEYGHDVGDKVLINFVDILIENMRKTDTIIRTGGDEFIIVLPHTTFEQTMQVVSKFNSVLNENRFVYNDLELKLSASFGAVEYNDEIDDIEDLLKAADDKMYQVKKGKGACR